MARTPAPRRARSFPLERTLPFGLALALGLALLPPPASAGAWSEGPVEVSRMRSPCFLEVARSGERRPLRIPGVDCAGRHNPDHHRAALQAARSWIEAGPPRLEDVREGERGELVGTLRLHDGSLLGERLVAEGYAILLPEALPEERATILALAQRNARRSGRGIWGDPVLDTHEVEGAQHRIATVCGGANGALRQPDGGWLLYVGMHYPQRDLGVRIPGEFVERFERPDRGYLQHEICVTGRIEPTTVAAEMVLADPTQIEVKGFTQ